jgi:hypothetical protein
MTGVSTSHEPAQPPRSLMARFRDRMVGRTGAVEVARFGSIYDGPFAKPPEEHVELDPDLPWELRDDAT